VLERTPDRPPQALFMTKVMIGWEDYHVSIGIARQHPQQWKEHSDRGSPVRWLGYHVLRRQDVPQLGSPPFLMLVQNNDDEAGGVDEISRAGDGQLEQRVPAIDEAVLLGDVLTGVVNRATAQTGPHASGQNDRPGVLAGPAPGRTRNHHRFPDTLDYPTVKLTASLYTYPIPSVPFPPAVWSGQGVSSTR
jgi:hypothetical protein